MGRKNGGRTRFGPPLRMGPRPSPFKSRCVAMLNFKNGVCILPAPIVPPTSSFPFLTPLRPRPLVLTLFRALPLNSPFAAARRARAATGCIVYAAIRETYCLPANNERFPREISAVFISPQARSLRTGGGTAAIREFLLRGILCELFRRNLRMLFPLQPRNCNNRLRKRYTRNDGCAVPLLALTLILHLGGALHFANEPCGVVQM